MTDTGYEMVMHRMDTHPEDFAVEASTARSRGLVGAIDWGTHWHGFARILLTPDKSKGFITENQRSKLEAAYNKIQREAFDVEVMKHLLGAEDTQTEDTQADVYTEAYNSDQTRPLAALDPLTPRERAVKLKEMSDMQDVLRADSRAQQRYRKGMNGQWESR